jgi:tetratricopeptide (TPR) repeat protein
MKRWTPLWLAIVALAPRAFAAEPELAIELPDVTLVLPRVSPPHFQQEGLPYLTENQLVLDLLSLVERDDYEGALARAKETLGAELTLLEIGDPVGLLGGRIGAGRLPIPRTGTEDISASVLYVIGMIYFQLERYEPAEAALKAALGPLPDYLRVHEALGLLYVRTERYADARVHLARAAELGLNTAGLHATLGYINRQAKNWWGAASAFQQALAIKHDERNWQTGLLQALNETQQ